MFVYLFSPVLSSNFVYNLHSFRYLAVTMKLTVIGYVVKIHSATFQRKIYIYIK